MPPNTTTTKASESSTTEPTTCKSELHRQQSSKRQNSVDIDQTKRQCCSDTRLIPCPLTRFGCTVELTREGLLEHYLTEMHQNSLMKAIEIYVRELHSKPFPNDCQSHQEQFDDIEMIQTIDTLAEGVSCLQDEILQSHHRLVQLMSDMMEQKKQMEQIQNSIEESLQIQHAHDVNSKIIQNELETVKQTLSDFSSLSSNDGSYIWKITSVSEKLENAASDRQSSVYSPSFYSSPTGYKMCLRLYFNGDGQARRTHVSLFFVVMRGEYDPILTWPFSYKVTFCLYDQTVNQRHIIDSFRPDIKSNSFQRPRAAMNIAAGIPKFAPISVVRDVNSPYVRDDCMFIKCFADFDSLSQACASYAIKINPGLPMFIRQKAIEAEVEKQRRPMPKVDNPIEPTI